MPPSSQEPGHVTRPPVHAGQFYPGDAGRLRATVDRLMAEARPVAGPVPKALIAPHAGYVYSGPIAASAYAQLQPARQVIRRVVLIGPSHFVRFRGVAITKADAFLTPLGLVPLDRESVALAQGVRGVHVIEEAHEPEHSLEVHLPFLQVVLADFRLVPLLVGDSEEEQVGQVLDALWGGEETCLIVSSDLSHYHDYTTAQSLDRATALAIESLRSRELSGQSACGWEPIRGLLYVARRRGLCAHTIDLRNSGDTAGPTDRVVGYGAFIFVPAAAR